MSNEREGLIRQIADRISQHCGGFTAEYSMDCAEDVLDLLPQAQEPVAWAIEVTVRTEGAEPYESFDMMTPDEGEAQQMLGIYSEGANPRLVPLYASPVASAPERGPEVEKNDEGRPYPCGAFISGDGRWSCRLESDHAGNHEWVIHQSGSTRDYTYGYDDGYAAGVQDSSAPEDEREATCVERAADMLQAEADRLLRERTETGYEDPRLLDYALYKERAYMAAKDFLLRATPTEEER